MRPITIYEVTEADEQAINHNGALANIRHQIEDGYHPGSPMVQMFEDAARRIGVTQDEIDTAKEAAMRTVDWES